MSKLTLKKETLAELTTDQLRMVFGGAAGTDSCSCSSCGCSCNENSCNTKALAAAFDRVGVAYPGYGAIDAIVAVSC